MKHVCKLKFLPRLTQYSGLAAQARETVGESTPQTFVHNSWDSDESIQFDEMEGHFLSNTVVEKLFYAMKYHTAAGMNPHLRSQSLLRTKPDEAMETKNY